MKIENLLVEMQYTDRVCECNDITRGELLKFASFHQNNSPEEIIKGMVKQGCGCCLKSLDEWKKSSCAKKKELKVHYSEVLRDF